MSNYLAIMRKFDVPGLYDLEALVDTVDSLNIRLTSAKKSIECTFEYVFAYRRVEEGDVYLLLEEITEGRSAVSSFYIANNSSFKSWFLSENLGVVNNNRLLHVCIVTKNFIIDVISDKRPKIRLLGMSETT